MTMPPQTLAKPSLPAGYRWIVLAVATLSQASAAFVTQGILVLAGFLQLQFGLSGAQVGLLVTASSFAPILSLLLVGDLLDRKPERSIILFGAGTMALSLVAAAWGSSYPLMLAGLFFVGIGYSTVQPGGSRSVSTWFRDTQRGTAMGIRQAGLPLGGALAAAMLPHLTSTHGYRAAFLCCALVAISGGLLFWRLYRPPDIEIKTAGKTPLRLADALGVLRRAWMRRIVIAGAAMVSAQYAIVVYLMLFLRDRHGLRLEEGAILLIVVQAFGAAGRIALSMWTDLRAPDDRFRTVRTSMLATCAGLAVLWVMPQGTPLWAWMPLAAWLGFFALGWYGPWVTTIADSAETERVGLALGVAMTANQVAIISVPPMLGALYDHARGFGLVWGLVIAWLLLARGLIAFAGSEERAVRPA